MRLFLSDGEARLVLSFLAGEVRLEFGLPAVAGALLDEVRGLVLDVESRRENPRKKRIAGDSFRDTDSDRWRSAVSASSEGSNVVAFCKLPEMAESSSCTDSRRVNSASFESRLQATVGKCFHLQLIQELRTTTGSLD